MPPTLRNRAALYGARFGIGFAPLLLLAAACNRSGPSAIQTEPSSAPATNPVEKNSADDAPRTTTSEQPLPLHALDRGIFDDLDEHIETVCPSWTEVGPYLSVHFEGANHRWLAVDGVPFCQAPPTVAADGISFPRRDLETRDRDGDGIPDALDILRGAKKAAQNGATYRSEYRELAFPGGDVPRDEGVCTDVIVRALRNAGYDLQQLLAEDIAAHRARYPMVEQPNRSIDHRRVRTLLPYFRAHFTSLPTDPRDTATPYLPGDVLFMNTVGDGAPEHMGIVSDRTGHSGLPLVINNWTDGWQTQEMDLLDRVPVTHRFRVARPLTHAPAPHAGVSGLLARRKIRLPDQARQMVLVTAPLWNSSGGTLTRFQRVEAGTWEPVGEEIPVRLGSAGLGCGRGLHDEGFCEGLPPKREGDKRAPAGLFRLGTAFGRAPQSPVVPGTWPYRATNSRDWFVDDPSSPDYNTWQIERAGVPKTWSSAERLTMYSLGLVVHHNTESIVPGAGSAIFLHPWKGPAHPTVGCTAMAENQLVEVLRWLDPSAHPVLVQIAGRVFQPL